MLTTSFITDQTAPPEKIVKSENTSHPTPPKTNVTIGTKRVVVVPGYSMALAQAQSEAKHIADLLEQNGNDVKFGIYAVAGRMPGHMYVLLTELEVPYEKEYGVEEMNSKANDPDLIVVVGAADFFNKFQAFFHKPPSKKNLLDLFPLLND